MTVQPERLPLAAEFPPATREQWRELALGVLRKSGVEADSPEDALSSPTYDGVTVFPLYDSADVPRDGGLPGLAPFVRGARPEGAASSGWDVRQRHAVPDPEAVLADLENGVTSLWLEVGDHAIPVSELARVLKDVYLDLAPVVLDAGDRSREAAEALLALAAERGVSPSGSLGLDPLGRRARTGAESTLDVDLVRRCVKDHPGLRAVVVDATPYHDAGAGEAEELGLSIATGLAYLRELTEAGLTVAEALGQIDFRYAATADQFLTIAKLRAARRLWARVAQVCGEPDLGGQRQHAVTSSAMMTARDPWVNMLRTTLACFAAGVGGAEAVTVQPFDAVLGLPDAFSRRIARNTHTLLVEEAGVARVVDPAGGSWYAERLTADLAEAAWERFQDVERSGGMAEALASGQVAGRLAATASARAADVARRKLPITGVSEFPNLAERLPVRTAGPGLAGASAGGGLPRVRYAEEYEALRDLADGLAERPSVFLATLGPIAVHTARATFAANLFQAGGVATVTSGPSADPAELAEAFRASGCRVACLCSSDRFYAEHAEAVAAALKDAGAVKVWLAGKGEHIGVDARLYAGCDALEVLRTTFDDLGVAR
ncbi:methylmalonyl-CoA mutase subunit beta [Sinosporangium siamense]|uniref:methylmalonyl-CoA mutase n=1 Tax=Sinosporangium siamense TaxID=1367973 RepID=A0A919RJW4_9ACTN|nr:methylmalonyl-CoA mutase subunit beta [Sinosporangium siamense]GII93704.1 methylmalonyl-CoA mutase [Sinosporangium siamense]